MVLYHVTDVLNLKSIAEFGLIPQIGKRSQKINEQDAAIYFFRDKTECINALMNWLGEEFDEEDQYNGIASYHVVLECYVDNVENNRFYEILTYSQVPPENIRIIDDIQVDFEFDRQWIKDNHPNLLEFG